LEIYDLNSKTTIATHGLSFKIKQFFFSDENLYILSKDGVYDANHKSKWRPRPRKSFSGQGRNAMDMVSHGDKIYVILDNSNLVTFGKESASEEVTEIPISKFTPL